MSASEALMNGWEKLSNRPDGKVLTTEAKLEELAKRKAAILKNLESQELLVQLDKRDVELLEQMEGILKREAKIHKEIAAINAEKRGLRTAMAAREFDRLTLLHAPPTQGEVSQSNDLGQGKPGSTN